MCRRSRSYCRPSLVRDRNTRSWRRLRRLVQEENEAEYQRALVSIKESVRAVDGPDLRETLQEQIRQWFIECRDATGKFPDFPNAEDGGSTAIFSQKTPDQVAAELAAKEEEKEEKRKDNINKDKKGGKDRKDQKKDKKRRSKQKKGGKEEGEAQSHWTCTIKTIKYTSATKSEAKR
ncbi:dynein regulatory complex protein 11-like [Oncorhynchus nerka]|uniref:dynein regulatory complex protein 11-like n=1 Tax=Oncorhynchus nerka TaxID=8023 RepID=UPI0031B86975